MLCQRPILHLAGISLILTLSATAHAQTVNSENTLKLDPDAVSPPAKIAALDWLAGYWHGEGLGGECEEMWSPPVGDRMHGVFTLRKEGEIVFSEAMLLVEEAGSIVLKVKHFTAEFVGWEEKADSVRFPLVRLDGKEAYFNGLTFRLEDDGDLTIYVVLHSEGEATEHPFRFRRRPL